jgi:hypothetical protein
LVITCYQHRAWFVGFFAVIAEKNSIHCKVSYNFVENLSGAEEGTVLWFEQVENETFLPLKSRFSVIFVTAVSQTAIRKRSFHWFLKFRFLGFILNQSNGSAPLFI